VAVPVGFEIYGAISRARDNDPWTERGIARWWPRKLPAHGQQIWPRGYWRRWPCAVVGGLVGLRDSSPARVWGRRIETPEVWQSWALHRTRSTVTFAMALGTNMPKPAGRRFDEVAMNRFS
jgi:hypothetical protein